MRTIRWSQDEIRNPCLPLMRKVAKPQVLSEGEITCLSNFDALLVLRQGFSPSVCAQAHSQLPHQVEPKNGAATLAFLVWWSQERRNPCLPLMRKVAAEG